MSIAPQGKPSPNGPGGSGISSPRRYRTRATVASVGLAAATVLGFVAIGGSSAASATQAAAQGSGNVVTTVGCNTDGSYSVNVHATNVVRADGTVYSGGLVVSNDVSQQYTDLTYTNPAGTVTFAPFNYSGTAGTTVNLFIDSTTSSGHVDFGFNFVLACPPAPTVVTPALCTTTGNTVNGQVNIPTVTGVQYQSKINGSFGNVPSGLVTQPPGERDYQAIDGTTEALLGSYQVTVTYTGGATTCTVTPPVNPPPAPPTTTPAACPAPFNDVPADSQFCVAITYLKTRGITKGYADGGYHPGASITREAEAAFVYRYLTSGAADPTCQTAPFTDVPVTSPFCGDITWLVRHHIAKGYANGKFYPTAPISRQAMLAFVYRIQNPGQPDPTCQTAPFTDVPVTSPFCGDITYGVNQGIAMGYGDGTFHPAASTTRQAEAAFFSHLK